MTNASPMTCSPFIVQLVSEGKLVAELKPAVGLSLYGFATAENVLQIRHFLLWQNSQADIQRTGVYYTTKTAILSIAAGNVQAHMAVFPRLGK